MNFFKFSSDDKKKLYFNIVHFVRFCYILSFE